MGLLLPLPFSSPALVVVLEESLYCCGVLPEHTWLAMQLILRSCFSQGGFRPEELNKLCQGLP